jgi:serine protease Do
MKQFLKVLLPVALLGLGVSCSDYDYIDSDPVDYISIIDELENKLAIYESSLETPMFVASKVNEAQQFAMKANIAISTEEGIGSGVVFASEETKDGMFIFYALTNYHVIEDIITGRTAEFSVVNYAGYMFDFSILVYDKSVDLGLISFIGEYYDAYVLDLSSDPVSVGDFVMSMGSPQEQLNVLTVGWILRTDVSGTEESYFGLIHHNALVDSGNSGGALLNEHLEVVGINSIAPIVKADFPFQSVEGYAASYPTIEKFLNNKDYGRLLP